MWSDLLRSSVINIDKMLLPSIVGAGKGLPLGHQRIFDSKFPNE